MICDEKETQRVVIQKQPQTLHSQKWPHGTAGDVGSFTKHAEAVPVDLDDYSAEGPVR